MRVVPAKPLRSRRTRLARTERAQFPSLAAVAVFLGILCGADRAAAGAAFNATATTDFRYRGVSLSDQRPALTVGVSYDHPSGAYVSAVAIGALKPGGGAAYLGEQIYAGRALSGRTGLSWDVGLARTQVKTRGREPYSIRYTELYAGASRGGLNAYVYLSPDYMGEGAKTVYASLGGTRRLEDDWRVVGHVGLLAPVDRKPRSEIRKAQFDTSIGLGRRIGPIDAQLRWTLHGPGGGYAPDHPQSRQALMLSATVTF